MKHLKKLIREDKILSFTEYKPTKYDGKALVDNMMIWLRNFKQKDIQIPLDTFLDQTQIDKDKFLTFVQDLPKTKRVEFEIEIKDDNVIFRNLNQKKDKMVWEESNESIEDDKQLELDVEQFLECLNHNLQTYTHYDFLHPHKQHTERTHTDNKGYEIVEIKWDEKGKNFLKKWLKRWPSCGYKDLLDNYIDFGDMEDIYEEWYEEEYPERVESEKFNM